MCVLMLLPQLLLLLLLPLHMQEQPAESSWSMLATAAAALHEGLLVLHRLSSAKDGTRHSWAGQLPLLAT
jgi:hypothetical protein